MPETPVRISSMEEFHARYGWFDPIEVLRFLDDFEAGRSFLFPELKPPLTHPYSEQERKTLNDIGISINDE